MSGDGPSFDDDTPTVVMRRVPANPNGALLLINDAFPLAALLIAKAVGEGSATIPEEREARIQLHRIMASTVARSSLEEAVDARLVCAPNALHALRRTASITDAIVNDVIAHSHVDTKGERYSFERLKKEYANAVAALQDIADRCQSKMDPVIATETPFTSPLIPELLELLAVDGHRRLLERTFRCTFTSVDGLAIGVSKPENQRALISWASNRQPPITFQIPEAIRPGRS